MLSLSNLYTSSYKEWCNFYWQVTNEYIVLQVAVDFVRKMLFKSLSQKILNASLAGTKLNHSKLLNDEILSIDQQLMPILQQSKDPSG